MRRLAFILSGALLSATPSIAADDSSDYVYTLYRTSPAGEARIHVATFDAKGEAPSYNKGNCEMVVRYMSKHAPAGYYWCEPGRFRLRH